MFAYKGFNSDLTCTRGKGTYQYKIGKWHKEDNAKCANTGFHCCENPLDCLTWYSLSNGARFFLVEIGGDIHEDGNERISCTRMRLVKELTPENLALHACRYMYKHPNISDNKNVQCETGEARENDRFVIVRGKSPKAAGDIGTTLYLLQEATDSREITGMVIHEVDGKSIEPGKYYGMEGVA